MSELPYEIIVINPRLRLRQLQLADAERVFSLVDADREYLAKYLPWADKTTEVEHSRDFIKLMLDRRESGDEYGYGIEYDGMIIGHTSIMHLKDRDVPEIGYWIGSDNQEKRVGSPQRYQPAQLLRDETTGMFLSSAAWISIQT